MKIYYQKICMAILALLGGIGGNVNGQVPTLPTCAPDPTVYSPQTSAMMRYDDTPVNMCAGRLDLTIPLVDVQDKDFDFPISLYYNSDGFKPQEADNYVGRGWSLRCGGMIYRQIRGIPDEMSHYHTSVRILEDGGTEYFFDGFMSMIGKKKFDMDEMRSDIAQNPYKYARGYDDYAPMPTIPSTNIESAPDMYYFSFGKHSGKFMINFDGTVTAKGNDGQHYEVDLSEYEMTKGLFAHSTIIRLKTDDGYVYTFGGDSYGPVEYTAASWEEARPALAYDAYHRHVINAWYLTEIKAPNGRCLTIHYKDIPEKYHKNINELLDIGRLGKSQREDIAMLYSLTGRAAYRTPELMGLVDPPGWLPDRPANSYYYNLTKIALIDYITVGDGCRIDFEYSLKRDYTEQHFVGDALYNFRGAQLRMITTSHEGESTHTHLFFYTSKCANRSFLYNMIDSHKGSYDFSYNIPNDDVLPTTSNIDHWGYWTGKTTETYIMPGSLYANNIYSYDVKMTNLRNPSSSACDATLLQSVIYPTGGKTTYEYEPHKYSSMFVCDALSLYKPEKRAAPEHEKIAGGARIKKVKHYDPSSHTPLKEIHYIYSGESDEEGILTYMPLYRCLGSYIYEDALWAVTLENSDGFGRQFNPSRHILYPEVCEYYVDAKRGIEEEQSPYKRTLFFTETRNNDYTDFLCPTYTRPECNPVWYVLPGGMGNEYFLMHRFRWPGKSESFKNGKILGEYYYDERHILKKEVSYEYTDICPQDYSLCIYVEDLYPGTSYGIFTHINKEYFNHCLLSKKQVYEFDNDYQTLTKGEQYKYDDSGYLKEQLSILPGGDTLTTSFEYLKERPKLVTDKRQTLRKAGEKKDLQCEHYEYRMMKNLSSDASWPVISDGYTGTDSLHLEKRLTNVKYDFLGNIVYMEKDEIPCIYIWGYQNQYLVAKIENATYEEISNNSADLDLELLSTLSVYDYSYMTDVIDGLRTSLPNAHITTYTYDPGVGMTSVTDASGKTMFYEYNSWGRLVQIYRLNEDGKKEILQLNEYNLTHE